MRKKGKEKAKQIETVIRIAVDAMGGDWAPREVVKGAVEAAHEINAEIVLVGQQEIIEKELIHYNLDGIKLTIHQAEDTINMDDDPVRAIRRKPDSSIVVGMNLVKSGAATAFVSGGSTGAVTAAALLILGRKKHIERPALAITFESTNGPVLFLDVGANADCKPEHLVQFAQMGNVYMQKIFNIAEPRIGLLSNGEEAKKGHKLARSAYPLLEKTGLNFIGNIEGHGFLKGSADVVVTDGFTGNVVIKLCEGFGEVFADIIGQSSNGNTIRTKAKGRVLNHTPGALLLGVNGNVVKTHGSSDSTAINQTIHVAERMIKQKVLETIGT
ncbi:MAG: phosphate acyltransferase PlsX [Dehalococcoidia bacterium]